MEPEHLLWAMLQDDQGIAVQVLEKVGVDRALVREDAEKAAIALPRASGSSVAAPAPSAALQRVVATAIDLASARGDTYVSTELLLLGLATSRRCRSRAAAPSGARPPTR